MNICTLYHDENNDILITDKVREAVKASDGIAAMGLRSRAVRDLLKEAADAGIPIVFYNCRLKNVDYLAFVVTMWPPESWRQVWWHWTGGRKARVGIFSEEAVGDDKIESYQERVQGFQQELEENYPPSGLPIVRSLSTTMRKTPGWWSGHSWNTRKSMWPILSIRRLSGVRGYQKGRP